MVWQDTALICLKGHVVNDSMSAYPHHNREYCQKCGSKTISECPSCSKNIPGEMHYESIVGFGRMEAPACCVGCGKPYPWAQGLLAKVTGSTKNLQPISLDSIKKHPVVAVLSAILVGFGAAGTYWDKLPSDWRHYVTYHVLHIEHVPEKELAGKAETTH
jgi:hypothetical protein